MHCGQPHAGERKEAMADAGGVTTENQKTSTKGCPIENEVSMNKIQIA